MLLRAYGVLIALMSAKRFAILMIRLQFISVRAATFAGSVVLGKMIASPLIAKIAVDVNLVANARIGMSYDRIRLLGWW